MSAIENESIDLMEQDSLDEFEVHCCNLVANRMGLDEDTNFKKIIQAMVKSKKIPDDVQEDLDTLMALINWNKFIPKDLSSKKIDKREEELKETLIEEFKEPLEEKIKKKNADKSKKDKKI